MSGAGKPPSRRSLILEYLEDRRPGEITPEVLADLLRALAERRPEGAVSARYVLDVAERAGVPAARELGGIPLDLVQRLHFHDLEAAEATLRDLHREQAAAVRSGNRQRADDCRRAVLRLRRRLEAMLRRPGLSEQKRAEKQEILSWVRVWLETPDLFPAWLDLRKRAVSAMLSRKA